MKPRKTEQVEQAKQFIKAGKSPAEASKLAGISHTTLYRHLAKKSQAKPKRAKSLIKVYDLPTGQVVQAPQARQAYLVFGSPETLLDFVKGMQ